VAQTWWKKWPGRLRAELKALRRAGIDYVIDRDAFAAGVLTLDVRFNAKGSEIRLVATFPALYPHFRFEVSAPDLDLDHHQHARSKQLCLLARGTENWLPSMLVAEVLTERMNRVLEAGASGIPAAQEAELDEQRQAEPFSDYLEYAAESIILVDGSWVIPTGLKGGTLLLGVATDRPRLAARHSERPSFRAAVLEIRSDDNRLLAAAPAGLAAVFHQRMDGRWIRASATSRKTDPANYLAEAILARPSLNNPQKHNRANDLLLDVVGVLTREEVAWRELGEAWVFVVRAGTGAGKASRVWTPHFIRTGACGEADLRARIPGLGVLADASIACVGMGGLGAAAAIEFAKAGVGRLTIIDNDHVDPGTAVRWPLGALAAGRSKTLVLQEFIGENWPYVEVCPLENRIGFEQKPTDVDRLENALGSANLIFDASAELGVQHYLSDLARSRGIPYVLVWTQPGGWGGLIARFMPGKSGGCWRCLQAALTGGAIPYPPFDASGNLQPQGCADPTFVATGFDLSWIATSAVRMAVGALGGTRAGSYPSGDWDVLVTETRGTDGEAIPPTSKSFVLTANSGCPVCRSV
jgi:hypothetical protein